MKNIIYILFCFISLVYSSTNENHKQYMHERERQWVQKVLLSAENGDTDSQLTLFRCYAGLMPSRIIAPNWILAQYWKAKILSNANPLVYLDIGHYYYNNNNSTKALLYFRKSLESNLLQFKQGKITHTEYVFFKSAILKGVRNTYLKLFFPSYVVVELSRNFFKGSRATKQEAAQPSEL